MNKHMTVKQLIELLSKLDPNAVIDMAFDEEGNGFGDIDTAYSEGYLKTGEHVFTLYPFNSALPEERYHNEEKEGPRI